MQGATRSVLAQALGVDRKNIYRRSLLEIKDLALVEAIKEVHRNHPAYGHKRVAIELGVNHKRTGRVMKLFGIKPPRRKGEGHFTTHSTANHSYTNLIKGLVPAHANFIFVSDLTYIKHQGKFLYPATVEDIFTREIIAAGVGTKHDSNLTLLVVERAIKIDEPVIFHSDQGTEFMARSVTSFLESLGIKVSVSDKGSPWQNGYKESFFGRFKEEFGDFERFASVGELIEAIYSHIHYYNYKRIHTGIRMPPATFRMLSSY